MYGKHAAQCMKKNHGLSHTFRLRSRQARPQTRNRLAACQWDAFTYDSREWTQRSRRDWEEERIWQDGFYRDDGELGIARWKQRSGYEASFLKFSENFVGKSPSSPCCVFTRNFHGATPDVMCIPMI
jgi:hypothetical protein